MSPPWMSSSSLETSTRTRSEVKLSFLDIVCARAPCSNSAGTNAPTIACLLWVMEEALVGAANTVARLVAGVDVCNGGSQQPRNPRAAYRLQPCSRMQDSKLA